MSLQVKKLVDTVFVPIQPRSSLLALRQPIEHCGNHEPVIEVNS